MQNEFELMLRIMDLVAAERAELSMSGPQFFILHRFWKPGTLCTPGEAIAEIRLLCRLLRNADHAADRAERTMAQPQRDDLLFAPSDFLSGLRGLGVAPTLI